MEKRSRMPATPVLLGGDTISDRVLLVAVAAWCATIITAPLFDSGLLYGLFSSICHQYPERSWFLSGQPLAVCIRCTSIYAGFLVALALKLPPRTGFLRFAVALTGVEVVIAHMVIDMEVVRSLSGLLLGLSAGGFVAQGVRELVGLLGRMSRRDSFENV